MVVALGSVGMASLQAPIGHADGITVEDVDRAGASIRQLGETTYPDVYANISVDESALTALLEVTALGPAANALVAAGGAVPVAVVVVPNAYAALKALQQRVVDDEAFWGTQGITITYVGPDAATNRLRIGILAYSETIATAMALRYGATKILIAEDAGTTPDADRLHDTSPYNGGIRLGSSTTACTAGHGIHLTSSATKSSGPYLFTAGHCFPNNTTISHNGRTIGTAFRSTNVYRDNGMDVEVVGATSSRLIWETTTARAQNDGTVTRPAIGTSLCHSGITTNKLCGKVTAVDACTWYPTLALHFCHLDTATSSVTLAQAGDSGGPWFIPYTYNGVRLNSAVGIHSGTATNDNRIARYTEIDYAQTAYNAWVNY
jgi:hypothetical protein